MPIIAKIVVREANTSDGTAQWDHADVAVMM